MVLLKLHLFDVSFSECTLKIPSDTKLLYWGHPFLNARTPNAAMPLQLEKSQLRINHNQQGYHLWPPHYLLPYQKAIPMADAHQDILSNDSRNFAGIFWVLACPCQSVHYGCACLQPINSRLQLSGSPNWATPRQCWYGQHCSMQIWPVCIDFQIPDAHDGAFAIFLQQFCRHSQNVCYIVIMYQVDKTVFIHYTKYRNNKHLRFKHESLQFTKQINHNEQFKQNMHKVI